MLHPISYFWQSRMIPDGNDWGLERSIADICLCVCMAAVCEAGCQTWNMFLCIGVLLCITVQLPQCQLMFHCILHAVTSLLCVITTFQSRSYLLVMPRPSEAVWGVGSSCILRLLKGKNCLSDDRQLFPVGLVSYSAQSCSPAADGTPKHMENKWWFW